MQRLLRILKKDVRTGPGLIEVEEAQVESACPVRKQPAAGHDQRQV